MSPQRDAGAWECCDGPGLEPAAYQLLLTIILASLVPPVSILSHPTPGKLGAGQAEMAAAPLWCLVGIIGKVGFVTTEVFQVPGRELRKPWRQCGS